MVASVLLSAISWNDVNAGTVTLRPNGDPASPVWSRSAGSNNWSILAQTGTADDPYICRSGSTAGDLYDMTTASIGQGATQLTVRAYASLARTLLILGDDQVGLNAYIGGSPVGATVSSLPTSNILSLIPSCPGGLFDWSFGWLTPAVYTGTWSQSQIDGLQLYLQKILSGVDNPIRVVRAEIEVQYTDPPTVTQHAYRLYHAANSVAPGTPRGATNTVADVSSSETFRLRLAGAVSGTHWSTGYGSLRLQYALKNAATCTLTTGWSDVSPSSGAIRWYDNTSVTNNATIASDANDPTTSGTKIYHYYRESNDWTTRVATNTTQAAVWDMSLQTYSASPGSRYCLRFVSASGSITVAYSVYPEIIVTGGLSTAIVDAGGSVVGAPYVAFDTVTALPYCQSGTATFGTNN